MQTPFQRKTHPMVLTAAVAVTIFSILGSAAITGLIPSAHSSRQEFTPMVTNSAGSGRSDHEETPFKSAITETKPHEGKAAARAEHVPLKQAANSREAATTCKVCGVIESIRTVEREGDASGLGAVAGGVAGGVLGNQIGKGNGNTLMTILGIGGGAYAGHTIEKNMKSSTAYVVKVRMEDGSYRSVTQPNQPDFTVGDHVRVVSGHLTSA